MLFKLCFIIFKCHKYSINRQSIIQSLLDSERTWCNIWQIFVSRLSKRRFSCRVFLHRRYFPIFVRNFRNPWQSRLMDYIRGDVLTEAELLLPAGKVLPDSKARWCIRSSSKDRENHETSRDFYWLPFLIAPQSFIRVYVLDNVYVCILVHILFYVALWYATTVSTTVNFAQKI